MGSFGNFIYRPSYGASGVSEYTNFDTGLVAIDDEVYRDQTHRQLTANAHGLVFTGSGSGGGLDSDKVDGLHASEMSGSSAFATCAATADWSVNSDKLDGLHSASFLLSGGNAQTATSASSADMLDGYHAAAFLLSGGTAQVALSASNSDMVDSYHAAAFLLSGGTAVAATSASDSDKLDGYHYQSFLLSGGNAQTATSASNADMLDGYHATAFLLSGGTAQVALSASDSDKLDGYHATSFLLSGGTALSANDSTRLNGVLAAGYLLSGGTAVASLSASDSDKLDGYHYQSFLLSGGTAQTALSAGDSYTVGGNLPAAFLLSGGNAQTATSASNADMLDGYHAAAFLLSGGTAQVALSASNSDMLDSYHAASFLLSGDNAQTSTSASDSDKLDGLHSASFLLSGGTAQVALSASNSDMVDSYHAAAFLLSGGTAVAATSASDSDMLDGLHASQISGGAGTGDMKSDGTVAFSGALSGTSAYFSSSLSASSLYGTAQVALSASNSDMIDSYHAVAFLLSGGTAVAATSASDSDKLDGLHSASFLLSGGTAQVALSAGDSYTVGGNLPAAFLLSGGTAQVALSASNSDMVDSYHAAAFLLSGGTAVAAMSASDSDMLDGYHAAAFLLSGGNAQTATSASSADMLDGYHAAAFLLSGGTAQTALSASNSDMIDGYHASQISGGAGTGDMKADGTVAFNGALSGTSAYFSNALSASSLYGTAQIALSASDSDKLDGYHATAFLLSGGTAQTTLSASDSDKVDGYHSSAFASSAHNTQHEAGGSDIIALDTLGAPTNITTLNATSSAHGLLPILDNSTIHYLRGDGTWQVPASGGIGNGDELSDGTIPFSNTLSGTSAYFSSSLSASSLYGTAQVALSASNADMLDTYHAASFLLSGGTAQTATSASDSDKLDGLHSASFLLSGGTAQVALSAGDSYTVGGNLPAAFLLSGGTAQVALSASNADMLDTYHAASFLLSGGTAQTATSASDSDKLDGYHAAAFLLSGGNAQTATSASNSDKLDGYHAASFVLSGGELWSRSSSLSAIYPTNIGDKVGIGTTSPGSLLHLDATNPEISVRSNGGTGIAALNLYYGGGDDTSKNVTGTKLWYDVASAITYFDSKYPHTAGQQFGDIQFRIAPVTGGTEVPAVTIQSTGNVGIGTVSPLAKLHEYHGTTYASGDGIRSEGYYPNFQFYSTYPDAAQRNWAIISPWNTIGALEFKVSSAQYGDPINAGTTKFIIQSNGNVGIGTVSPANKLSVFGNIGIDRGDGNEHYIGNDGSQNLAFSTVGSIASIVFRTLNYPTERMRIDGATGNVGIGTVSPAVKLEVSGPTITGSPWTAECFRWYSSTWPTIYGSLWIDGSGANTGISIGALTHRSIFIDGTNGNVGIGTVGPAYNLHVYGTNPVILLEGSGGAQFAAQTAGSGLVMVGALTNSRLALCQNWTEYMSIIAGGNVGIGTTAPTSKLHVLGDLNVANGPEMVINGGMETGDPPTGWTADGGILSREVGGQSGYCLQIAQAVGGGPGYCYQTVTGLIVGKRYRVGLWHKKGTATQGRIVVGSTFGNDNYLSYYNITDDTDWTLYTADFTALTVNCTIYLGEWESGVAGATAFFDGVSLVEIGDAVVSGDLSVNGTKTFVWDTSGVGSLPASLKVGLIGTGGSFTVYTAGYVGVYSSGLNISGTHDGANTSTINIGAYGTPAGGHGSVLAFITSNGTAATEKMRIDRLGNVGIGTVSPAAKLTEYHGATYAAGDGIRSQGTYPNFQLYSEGASDDSRNWAIVNPWDINGSLSIRVSTAKAGDPINAGDTKLIISKAGNVGIGTVSPNVPLDFGTGAANKKIIVGIYTGGNYWTGIGADASVGLRLAGDPDVGAPYILTDIGFYSITAALADATWTSRMVVLNSGNVGIRTVSPSATLEVNGTTLLDGALSGTSAYFSSSLSASQLYGTVALASAATSAGNSYTVGGYLPAAFLLSGGTAVAATSASNSDMVDGLHASQISGGAGTGDMKADGTVAFSGMLSGTSAYFSSSLSASLLYGTAQVALSASNSDKLDGFHASELTAAGGTTVLYGTGSAPAASGYADGTVWIQYV